MMMMDVTVMNETRIAKVEDAEKALMRGDFYEALVLFAQIANLSAQMHDDDMATRFSTKAAKMKAILDSMAPEEQAIYGYASDTGAGFVACQPRDNDTGSVCHELFMRINRIERHLIDLDLRHVTGEIQDKEFKARRAALFKIRHKLESSM